MAPACDPGVDLGFADSSTHGGHYADPLARKYRTGKIDGHVRKVPAAITRGLAHDPLGQLGPLVRYLVSGDPNQYVKIKRIHDWIADNIAYDAQAYKTQGAPSQAVAQVLRSRKALCVGYAELFQSMAEEAGLDSHLVNGSSRGYQYLVSGGTTPHAWNVVRVDRRYYHLDITRDAGSVSNGAFKKTYSTRYLFLAPVAFIYSNFPDDPGYQLLERELSRQEFDALPYLNGYFFQHHLGIISGLSDNVQVSGSLKLQVGTPSGTYLKSLVQDARGAQVQHSAFGQRQGSAYQFVFQPPGVGTYLVQLHARLEAESSYRRVAAFRVRKTKQSPAATPYPLLYSAFVDHDGNLSSPMEGELKRNATRHFRVTVPGAGKVYLYGKTNRQLAILSAGKGGIFTGSFKVPASLTELNVAAMFSGSKSMTLLLKYRVR